MSDLKYKIILKTSHHHVSRVENCLKTWLNGLDYVCLTDKLTGKFNEISGSDRDDYHSAEEKTVYFLNKVKDTSEFDGYDWLVFIDDDAILNVKRFEHIIKHLNKEEVYGIVMNGYPKEPELLFPSGGGGYFISPSLIKNAERMHNQNWGVEDVSIGKWVKENNLEMKGYYLINSIEYSLNLNGWWPFTEQKLQLTEEEQNSPNMRNLVIAKASNDSKAKSFVLTHLTHHYLRELVEFEYVYGLFKDWTP